MRILVFLIFISIFSPGLSYASWRDYFHIQAEGQTTVKDARLILIASEHEGDVDTPNHRDVLRDTGRYSIAATNKVPNSKRLILLAEGFYGPSRKFAEGRLTPVQVLYSYIKPTAAQSTKVSKFNRRVDKVIGWDHDLLGDLTDAWIDSVNSIDLSSRELMRQVRSIEIAGFLRSLHAGFVIKEVLAANPDAVIVVKMGTSHWQDGVLRRFFEKNGVSAWVAMVPQHEWKQNKHQSMLLRIVDQMKIRDKKRTLRDLERSVWAILERHGTIYASDPPHLQNAAAWLAANCQACQCMVRELGLSLDL